MVLTSDCTGGVSVSHRIHVVTILTRGLQVGVQEVQDLDSDRPRVVDRGVPPRLDRICIRRVQRGAPPPIREIGILLPNNKRQHLTLHIQEEVLLYASC